MKLEMAFRIFRKLNRRSADMCHVMIIERDMEVNPVTNPTDVKVKMVPRRNRKFSSTELSIINPFCKYHNIKYEFTQKGEIEWKTVRKSVSQELSGKKRLGKM